jgi:hypothetical protein
MAVTKTTAPAKVSALDKLNQLALAGKVHEDVAREEVAGQNNFIKLIGDPEAKELNSTKPEFIKGAKYKSFVISNKKVHLGMSFECTIVGMFKLYEETEVKKEGNKDLPKIFGYWIPEDAENIPVEGMFDRPFLAKDGTTHLLKPVHWLAVRLDAFPDMENVVISFRSTGNGIYAKLAKAVKNACDLAPQLKIKVTSQAIENKDWGKTNLFPDFEIIGKNFDFVDGSIKLIPEAKGGMTPDDLEATLTMYAHLNEEYAENRMVSKKSNIAALIGSSEPPKALSAGAGKGKAARVSADDDGETGTKF